MPLPIYHLRRLLAATAIVLTLVVAGMYFYARLRTRNVLQVPGKIGIEIKQTATGFQFSKSDGKRTLFTVQANNIKEFKLNGRAELHDVSIVLYGRDSSRYDQIYGDDFAYDPKTGDVTAQGDVQIDLVANPAGLASPDQATPKELKNPIHLKTRDLVFNKESGNAWAAGRVEFRTTQASGWAVGVKYAGKSNVLTLSSQIHLELTGANAAVIEAERGTITGETREVVLEHPHLDRQAGTLQADQAVFYLGPDNNVQRVLATGHISAEMRTVGRQEVRRSGTTPVEQASEMRGSADQAEFLLTDKGNLLQTATLSGNVHLEQAGTQPLQGDAGRAILEFSGRNLLQKVHAVDGARLAQRGATSPSNSRSQAQDFELNAPAIDFKVRNGKTLERAVTSGAAKIVIVPAQEPPAGSPQTAAQRTVVTAGRFEASFAARSPGSADRQNRLRSVLGLPDARIVNSSPGQPDRVSTSDSVEAVFLPAGGIESFTQQGNVAYGDGQGADKRTEAFAVTARYTPADQELVLTGNPRVVEGAMTTTSKTVRINRATGDALAEGDVKSTYRDLKEQPDGALLASASPIHVTARSMTARKTPGVALYTGGARLWQDANVIEAPSIQFDRDRRFVTAQGTVAQPVQTILVQAEKDGKKASAGGKGTAKPSSFRGSSPVAITASQMTYADAERKIRYEGGVLAKGSDFTASAKTLDAYLLPRSQTSGNPSFSGPGQLDRMVAQGDVVIRQATRRAEGQELVYTAAEEKFVLTGGPPSIFDAEQGKITGVSLTFFRRDDRVLVEGEANSPVVTETRVAH